MIISVPTTFNEELIESIHELNNKYKRVDHEDTSCY